jgi:hypothetical protein
MKRALLVTAVFMAAAILLSAQEDLNARWHTDGRTNGQLAVVAGVPMIRVPACKLAPASVTHTARQ